MGQSGLSLEPPPVSSNFVRQWLIDNRNDKEGDKTMGQREPSPIPPPPPPSKYANKFSSEDRMRFVKGRYYENHSQTPLFREFDDGRFLCWGQEFTAFETDGAVGISTIAIVELACGNVVTVAPRDLIFVS